MIVARYDRELNSSTAPKQDDDFKQGGKSNGLEKWTNYPSQPPSSSPSAPVECQKTSLQWKGLRFQLRQREGKSFRATGGLPGAGKPCLKVARGSHSGEDVLEVCGVVPKAPLGWRLSHCFQQKCGENPPLQ